MIFKNCRGQATLEMALTMPILLLVLMGIIDFGLLFNDYLVLENASREAARLAVTGTSNEDIYLKIQETTASLKQNHINKNIEPENAAQRVPGSSVMVRIEYEHEFLTPIIGAFFNNKLKIESKTYMRME